MTNLCQKNIGKLIRNTYKVLKKAEETHADASLVLGLNKNYKAEITMEQVFQTEEEKAKGILPRGGELIYYILDKNGVAIDQVTLGWTEFDDDIDEPASKELSYLLNMYC